MNKLLIVIDAQEDFTRGSLRNEEAIAALPVIRDVVSYAYRNFERRMIYTKDTHFENYLETQEGKNLPVRHCIRGSNGWRLCTEVLCEKSKILEKPTFGYKEWDTESFGDLNEIWLCGFCTDICVMANFQIIKAHHPEIPIVVIEDGCAGTTPELHEAALKVLASCQARVVKWDELKNEEGQ